MRRNTGIKGFLLGAVAMVVSAVVFLVPFAFIVLTAVKDRSESADLSFSWPTHFQFVQNLQEVIAALTEAMGSSMEAVESVRLAKRSERGGFTARVYNPAIEADETCPAAAYYLARPEQYPPIDD